MPFQQLPPNLGNQYEDDRVLRSYLARVLPEAMLREIEPSLREMGQLAAGRLYELQLADRLNEPTLTQWDAWGNRIDHVEVTRLWREAERIAVDYGLVAIPYEQKHGSLSRVHQCALAYLFTPSTDIYSCPLAMTDGAARTLLNSGNQALIDRAVPHLITRKLEEFWTAGQWMTEITGGSDVGLSQTVAVRTASGSDRVTSAVQSPTSNVQSASSNSKLETRNSEPSTHSTQHSELATWRLHGNKWFASAITSQIALTLARPEGNPPGGRGLALFYVEIRDESGQLRNIQINRLKDKLGTRKVPTAELTLVGTPAQLVKGVTDGVRNIAPLLNITRLWNGISAVALMRRGVALAADYSSKRAAFGAVLSKKSLHLDTLAGLQAEAEAAFHLAFYVAELTGRAETTKPVVITASEQRSPSGQSALRGGSDRVEAPEAQTSNVQGLRSEDETLLLRLLTPIMKLTTGKQAAMVLSEVVEAFGGAGYVEDTGLPQLLRDSQVLPIWEGTTNVLSLDTLRAMGIERPTSNVQSPTSDDLHVRTGSGSDRVEAADVRTGSGRDRVEAAGVRTGSGSDLVEAADVSTGSGSDLVEGAEVRTGSGSDRVAAADVRTGSGSDWVEAPAVTTGKGDPAAITQVGMSQGQEGGLAITQDGLNSNYGIKSQLNVGSTRVSPAFDALKSAVLDCLSEATDPGLEEPVRTARSALAHAEGWLAQTSRNGGPALEAAARRLALTLGRTMELALLIKQAQWSQRHESDSRPAAAARRFAASGVDLLVEHSLDDALVLMS